MHHSHNENCDHGRTIEIGDILPKDVCEQMFEVVTGDEYETAEQVHDALTQLLTPYEEQLTKNDLELDSFIRSFMESLLKLAESSGPKAGSRVKVWNGDQSKYLGEGTYEGEVAIYLMQNPDNPGEIRSCGNAEVKPPEDQIPAGWVVRQLPKNPKIRLDAGGKVIYGCQCWWKSCDE